MGHIRSRRCQAAHCKGFAGTATGGGGYERQPVSAMWVMIRKRDVRERTYSMHIDERAGEYEASATCAASRTHAQTRRRRTRRTFIGRTDERPFRGAMIERSHFRREVWTFQDACVRVPLQTHATSRTATLQFGSGSACSQPISINSAGRVDSVTPTLGRSMMVTPCVNWGSES